MIRVHASEQSSPWWGADGLHIVLLQSDPLSAQVVNVGCMHIWVAVSHIHPTYKYDMLNWTKQMLMKKIPQSSAKTKTMLGCLSFQPGSWPRRTSSELQKKKNNSNVKQWEGESISVAKFENTLFAPSSDEGEERGEARQQDFGGSLHGERLTWGRAFTAELGWRGIFIYTLVNKTSGISKQIHPVTPTPTMSLDAWQPITMHGRSMWPCQKKARCVSKK